MGSGESKENNHRGSVQIRCLLQKVQSRFYEEQIGPRREWKLRGKFRAMKTLCVIVIIYSRPEPELSSTITWAFLGEGIVWSVPLFLPVPLPPSWLALVAIATNTLSLSLSLCLQPSAPVISSPQCQLFMGPETHGWSHPPGSESYSWTRGSSQSLPFCISSFLSLYLLLSSSHTLPLIPTPRWTSLSLFYSLRGVKS